jgi:hypothetical protein
LPVRHRVVVASGGSGRVEAYESAPAAVASVDGLEDADNVRFDARADRVLVGYGHALAVLDAKTLAVTRRTELPGHPEAFELEPSGSRVYVNVPSAGQIVVVDGQSGTIASTWPVTGAAGNFPMALDASANRLYVATRRPALLQAYDTMTGKRVSELPIGADPDDLFFDAQTTALRGLRPRRGRRRAPAQGRSSRARRAGADRARREVGTVRAAAFRRCSSPFQRVRARWRKSAPTRSDEGRSLDHTSVADRHRLSRRMESAPARDAREHRFAAVFSAFAARGVDAQPAVYNLAQADELREQLLAFDGVLVWLNPIEAGQSRAPLDAVLREVADAGVFVSTHPDVIMKLGTKDVLFAESRALAYRR